MAENRTNIDIHAIHDLKQTSHPEVGDEVEVYWPIDDKFYPGLVVTVDDKDTKYHITYTDGEEEVLNISDEVVVPR